MASAPLNPFDQFDAPAVPPGFGPPPGFQNKGAMSDADLANANLEAQLKRHQLDTINRSPPPTGYRYKADGSLEAVPGGPGDSADVLDPATLTYYAQQVLAGAPMPALGMGKQAAAARQAIMTEVAHTAGASGLTGADLARQIAHYKAGSGQVSNLEKMSGAIGVNEQTALANGQQFLDRSAELPGQTRFAPVNAVSDWIQRRFGGTTISAADAAYTTFTNEYAKVVAGSPTGAGVLSDSARHEAMDTISGNGSLAQKQAAFDQMKADMANRMTAIHGGINNAYKALTRQPGYEVPDSTQSLVAAANQGAGGPSGVAGMPSGPGTPPGGAPPAGGGPAPAGGSMASLATGPTRLVDDPKAGALVDALVRKGASADEINSAIGPLGYPAVNPQDVATWQTFLQKNPGYKGLAGGGVQKAVPTTLQQRAAASPTGTGIYAGIDAALGGTSDEISGGINSLVNGVPLSQSIADANKRKQLAFATNPNAALVGDLAGGALGYYGGAKLLGGTALAAKLGRFAPYAGAAAYGAASGAGQDNDNRFGGAVAGAAGGVIGQGAGELAAIPIGAIARSRPAQAARGLFGRGYSTPTALSPAENAASVAITKAGPVSIRSGLDEASRLGVPMSLADTTPQLGALAGAAVRRSPNAAGIAEDALLSRNRGQIDRLGSAITRDLGPIANIPQTSADLTAQARAAAAPLYEKAYAAPGASSVDLSDLAGRPSMKAGLNRAYSIAQEEGRDPTTLGFGLNDQGEVTLNRTPSFQTLDYVKRGLDDTLEPHRNQITGKLQLNEATKAINNTKNDLLNRIDAVNPDYKAARAAYAGPVQSSDALARGADAFSLSPDELGMQVAGQSPEHLAQMQTGYRSALMNRANNVRDAGNPFEGALGSPASRARLDALYPGNPGNADLFRTRDLEGQLQRTSNDVLGGSQTAKRLIADKAFALGAIPSLALDAATAWHGHAPLATAGLLALRQGANSAAGTAIKNRLQRGAVAKADELAPMLLNTDPSTSAKIVEDLLNHRVAWDAYVKGSRPTRRSGMFGAALGGTAGARF